MVHIIAHEGHLWDDLPGLGDFHDPINHRPVSSGGVLRKKGKHNDFFHIGLLQFIQGLFNAGVLIAHGHGHEVFFRI